MILRRARGYAPKTFKNQYLVQSNSKAHVTLALGPHLKNTFTMGSNERLLLSQHIGDLESHQTQKFYLHEIQNFKNFYKLEPDILLHDMHPDYSTTVIANENFNNLKKFGIQHHEAHAWAGIFEYGLEKTDLCIAIWDGAGFGHDGKIWGGEFFLHKANSKELKRTGTLESYLLLGGEKSFHEPWRILLSLLFQFQDFKSIQKSISLLKIPIKESEYALLYQIWLKKINSPSSSSMGRIFDAFSYFLGISNYNHFEGESAMKLQFAAERFSANSPQTSSTLQPKWIYPPTNNEASSLAQLSFQPPLMHLIKELERTEKPFTTDQQNEFSYEFHLGLALSLLEWVKKTTNKSLLVGGGVFQNSLLLKLLIKLCEQDNIKLYYPKEIPINDGGISLGQTIAFYQKNRNLNTL
jgi:hydrogenase maturation protein HypF